MNFLGIFKIQILKIITILCNTPLLYKVLGKGIEAEEEEEEEEEEEKEEETEEKIGKEEIVKERVQLSWLWVKGSRQIRRRRRRKRRRRRRRRSEERKRRGWG